MNNYTQNADPMDFMRRMWGQMGFSLPGMITPTMDADELEKRITDLKAVEGWLRMNLSMLQMTIQGLEMQHATVGAMRAMGNVAKAQASSGDNALATEAAATAMSQAALWPWNMMAQMQQQMQQAADVQAPQAGATPRADTQADGNKAAAPPRR